MKKFFILTLLLSIFAMHFPVKAEEKSTVIMDLDERQDPRPVNMEEVINNFIDSAKYFDQQYPGDKINTDFHEDVARRFPALTPQEVYDYQGYIRNGMKIYRYAKSLYDRYKEALLTPEEPPLVADDDEYDLSSPDFDYIEADGTVVVQDFKKIISYSQNPREIKAYRAKIASEGQKKGKLKDFEELGYIFSQLELKKLLFYNIFYDSPLTGTRGIGQWQSKDKFKVRLITIETAVEDRQKIEGVLHLLIPEGYFITAVDSAKYFKPRISFEQSENLADIEYTLPLPTRLRSNDEDWTVYTGETAVSFTATPSDFEQELILRADLKFNLCQSRSQCETVELKPELTLKPGYSRDSSVATYIRMASSFLKPQPQLELQITSFNREQTTNGRQMLTLVFDAPETIESFNVFVGNKGGIMFERPRVSIDDRRATVRLLAAENGSDPEGKDFEITAEANRRYVLRQNLTPVNGKPPAAEHKDLLASMMLAAFFGGFLLNFMPCVFPFLALKLLSLTQFGARSKNAVRRNFALTLAGIGSAFILLTAALAGLKHLGYHISWGMQFQNPWLISLVVFIVLLFIARIWGIIDIKLPRKDGSRNAPNGMTAFLTGVFMLLLAVPCTVPFLGTALSFALAENTFELFAVLGCAALGLALPCLLMFMFPGLAILVPPPGSWIAKLHHFMLLMLFVALGWLLYISFCQAGGWFVFRLIIYGLLFWLFLWLRHFNFNMEYTSLPPELRNMAAHRIGLILGLFALFVYIGASTDGYFAAAEKNKQIKSRNLAAVTMETVEQYVKQGKTVLVTVDADWCLTCRYNEIMTLKNPMIVQSLKTHDVVVLNVDWTISSRETVDFMKTFGRSGLPFYALFSPLVPDGLILPEILNEHDLGQLIDNMSLIRLNS